jgi:uncharacterized protein YecT (DUF1311 family)
VDVNRALFLLLIVTGPLWAAEYEWSADCDQKQLSMNTCAKERFDFYDKRLNELFGLQMNYLKEGKYKNYLRQAQRAWIAFRDADCRYSAGTSEDSGSIWPLEHFSCLAERTRTRIRELESYVGCRQDGCPS